MKLIRLGAAGKEKPAVFINNQLFDVSAFCNDYDEVFFENNGLLDLAEAIARHGDDLPLADSSLRVGSPVARPSKIVCVGLNYADHAKETGAEIPLEPILFFKSSTALSGPFDPIIIPRNSQKTDWEVELAVVIGKKASYVNEADALDFVAGYCLHNDVSERAYQLERGGQWDKGKGCDSFAPIGPWLVTPDEVDDVNNLNVWLKVNGTKYQDSNTANLIFKIPFLISYISEFMTLLPGDIVSTGTPPGVGLGLKPPVYLKPGDIVELGIEGLGISKQIAKAYLD